MGEAARDPAAAADWSAMLDAFVLPMEVQPSTHALRRVLARAPVRTPSAAQGDVLLPFDGAGPLAVATADNWSCGNVQRLWARRLPP